MATTALVTGCSSGIGRATAERFDDAGWEVYATARDLDEIRDLGERGCRTLELDVTETAAAQTAVDRVVAESERLDCLVNNAGYGQFGAVEDVPLTAVREQFEVNTFGPLRLIHAALPRMRERDGGTIVNVGAGFGGLTVPGLGVYTGSKFALHSLTDALRQELSQTRVEVVLVEPGLVATDFYDRAVEELASIDRSRSYADLYRVLDDVTVIERGGPGINRPQRVAETILEAATVDRPKPVYRVGPITWAGTLGGAVVRGRVRDTLSRSVLRGLASDSIQRFLER